MSQCSLTFADCEQEKRTRPSVKETSHVVIYVIKGGGRNPLFLLKENERSRYTYISKGGGGEVLSSLPVFYICANTEG